MSSGTTRLAHGAFALVAAVGVAGACATSPASPLHTLEAAALPATPAGERMRQWLAAYNSEDTTLLLQALTSLYSPSALERRSPTQRMAVLRVWRADYGAMRIARVDSSRPYGIVATVWKEANRGWGQLYFDVDSMPPHTVTGLGLIPFVEPPDWRYVERVSSDSALAERIASLALALNARGVFSGVVLVARNGQAVVERAYGMADRERLRPNVPETAFELASVGKMFTAVAIAQLMDRGLLVPNTTIGELLPDYPRGPSSGVTVHQLLTMSSGIPDLFRSPRYWRNRSDFRVLTDYWRVFANDSLEFPSGTQWSYSNSNYLVLGAIVERLTGMRFAEYVERNVFAPASMTGTSYISGRRPDRARGYTRTRRGAGPGSAPNAGEWYPVADTAETEDSSEQSGGSPAGGGVSSVGDLARFGEAMFGRRLLSDSMTIRLLAPHIAAEYGGADGYGFETRRPNGVMVVGHGGAFPGVSNQVDYFPESSYAVIVLSNSDGSGAQAIANYARHLIAASAGRPTGQPPATLP